MKRYRVLLVLGVLAACAGLSPRESRAQVEFGDLGFMKQLADRTQEFNAATEKITGRIAEEKKQREEGGAAAFAQRLGKAVGKTSHSTRIVKSGNSVIAVSQVSLNALGEARLMHSGAQAELDELMEKYKGASDAERDRMTSTIAKAAMKKAAIQGYLDGQGAGDDTAPQEGRDYKVQRDLVSDCAIEGGAGFRP